MNEETKPSVWEQMSDIQAYINVNRLAKEYFGKSVAWLTKKLKGQAFNPGTAGGFKPEELEQLRQHLLDIARRIEQTAQDLR